MHAAWLTIPLLLAGCAYEPAEPGPRPANRDLFEEQVYPVLLRDCGFPACHGSRDRFFQVFGPGRTRLSDSVGPTAPPTDAEIERTFDRARSMLASADRAEESLFVRKPLEVDLGGAPHMGIDPHGRDVYDTDDESYDLLLRWARTGFPAE